MEDVARWCTRLGRTPGAIIALETAWALAQAWYADRLHPQWRRRTAAEAQAVFTRLGLTDPFWRLEPQTNSRED